MWKALGIFLCGCVLAITANSCTITLPQDIKGFAPVILTKPAAKSPYSLFRPTGQVSTFAEGSAFHFVCTGAKNSIVSLGVTNLDVSCTNGQFVDKNSNVVVLNTLLCKTIPESTLKNTNTKCANKATIYESGMMVDNVFYPIYEICYDPNSETTFYTHNTLYGAAIKYNIHESARRPFLATGMKYNTRTVNDIYTKKNQVKRFEELFGKDQKFYDEKYNFLSRGHLSPDADFMFGYEQFATYYYMNVAPQFQSTNGGNWLKVEDAARAVAAAYGVDIESYNGYFDIVQLPRSNGEMAKLYLDSKNEFEVPKYYFKALLDKASNAGIVFVNVNNPFITDGKSEEFCKNVCDKAGFNNANFADLAKGYTFCCTVADFKKTYKNLPKEVQAKNLLTAK